MPTSPTSWTRPWRASARRPRARASRRAPSRSRPAGTELSCRSQIRAGRPSGAGPFDSLQDSAMTSGDETVLHADYTVLCSGRDGGIEEPSRHGLFDFDTRVLSRHRLRLAGLELRAVAIELPERDESITVLHAGRGGGDASGPALRQDAIEIVLRRRV